MEKARLLYRGALKLKKIKVIRTGGKISSPIDQVSYFLVVLPFRYLDTLPLNTLRKWNKEKGYWQCRGGKNSLLPYVPLNDTNTVGLYLWQMLPSYNDTIGRALQDLPYSVIEPSRSSIQRPINLTPVQPTSVDQKKMPQS